MTVIHRCEYVPCLNLFLAFAIHIAHEVSSFEDTAKLGKKVLEHGFRASSSVSTQVTSDDESSQASMSSEWATWW